MNRRSFIHQTGTAGALLAVGGCASTSGRSPLFQISLAEWSFNKALFAKGGMTNLDFPLVARRNYGISAVEYVNQFFKDKARDTTYLAELKRRCDGEGVRSLLIMCDGEGALGDPSPTKRKQAVENHHKWVEAAKFLGCHSIRVNADSGGVGSFDEQLDRAADGLSALTDYGSRHGIHVIVENHGGLSSNGKWLAGVMKKVNKPGCGTLPDFGNFTDYDRYLGVQELMPFAKGVSAKSNEFDATGNEVRTDYRRMLKIVLDAGYRGFIGIEYEGNKLSEAEGVAATQRLLERVRAEMS